MESIQTNPERMEIKVGIFRLGLQHVRFDRKSRDQP
jgi:hypothetical protein